MRTFDRKWGLYALMIGGIAMWTSCAELTGSGLNVTPGNETSDTGNPDLDDPGIEQCTNVSILTVSTAFDSGDYDQSHVPANAIDDDMSTRWSSLGAPKWITLDLGSVATVTDLKIAFFKGDERTAYFYVETSTDNSNWVSVFENGESSGVSESLESFNIGDSSAHYVRISGNGTNTEAWNSYSEIQLYGCSADSAGSGNTPNTDPDPDTPIVGDLNPDLPPSDNFDLTDWYLSIPTDVDGSGTADSIKESALNDGYEHSDYFYTAADGGMVFRTTIAGYKTSTGTTYTRSELREMLRRGDTSIGTTGVNKNNWVFGSTTSEAQEAAGGVNGVLTATLAVNYVTTTGDDSQVGRVIVGQIHANDDEPLRLYYRKLPGNDKGSIYFAHEPISGSEQWIEMIGSRDDDASNPEDGIALDEQFSYRVDVEDHNLSVTIYRDGKPDITRSVDMTNSGFDDPDQYHYFKAGVYNQNKTGDDSDYVQATFYSLANSHEGYDG